MWRVLPSSRIVNLWRRSNNEVVFRHLSRHKVVYWVNAHACQKKHICWRKRQPSHYFHLHRSHWTYHSKVTCPLTFLSSAQQPATRAPPLSNTQLAGKLIKERKKQALGAITQKKFLLMNQFHRRCASVTEKQRSEPAGLVYYEALLRDRVAGLF